MLTGLTWLPCHEHYYYVQFIFHVLFPFFPHFRSLLAQTSVANCILVVAVMTRWPRTCVSGSVISWTHSRHCWKNSYKSMSAELNSKKAKFNVFQDIHLTYWWHFSNHQKRCLRHYSYFSNVFNLEVIIYKIFSFIPSGNIHYNCFNGKQSGPVSI